MNLPEYLPLSAYCFRVVCDNGGLLPPWPGSALRGVFGLALRNLACMTGAPDCEGCLLRSSCLYSSVFESPRVPHSIRGNGREGPNPYVMQGAYHEHGECVGAGQPWAFRMVLMGAALRHLPLLIMSWQRALTSGLTPRALRFRLQAVECLDTLDGAPLRVWSDTQPDRVLDHAPGLRLPSLSVPSRPRLRLLTPTRVLRQHAAQKPDNFEFENWLAALMRRFLAVAECHLGLTTTPWPLARVKEFAAGIDCEADLHWADWQRYSNRQGRKMDLGGLMGTLTLSGEVKPVWPLLYLGQWLHVGKNATFGLGGYTLDEPCVAGSPSEARP